MKYTRKEILKKTYLIGLPLFIPDLITVVHNYTKSLSNEDLTFEEESKKFINNLEEWVQFYSNNYLKLDMIIINDESINKFDFVFLTYDREVQDAPQVAIPKNEDYHPDDKRRLNADVKILKDFAHRHGIFILNEKYGNTDNIESRDDYEYKKSIFKGLIKRIRDCGDLNRISDDVFRPVAFAYAELYKYENKHKEIA